MASRHIRRTDSQAAVSGLYIPEDLIINILSWLPVKSLLRFETVSEAWLSIITNPTLVDLHLGRASENSDSLLVHSIVGSFNSVSLRCIDSRIKLSYFEGNLCGHLFIIVGSYNGIVCALLENQPRHAVFRRRPLLTTISTPLYSRNFHIYLWNPVTKQSKLLPTPQYCPPGHSKVYVGFGFDPTTNDFKVVKISCNKYKDAMIYSAHTDAWKKIESLSILPNNSIADCCVKGFLYWTGTYDMIRFDLNNEVFSYYKFPANVQKTMNLPHGRDCMKIIEMKDSSDVALCSYDVGNKNKGNLWTINDGFEGSWTLKFSFDVPQAVDWLHGNLNNSGDILYKTMHRVWLLYNSDKETTETAVKFDCSETFKHTESLVPIRGSEQLSEMLAKLKMI